MAPAFAQVSPVGVWHNIDDKTGEPKAADPHRRDGRRAQRAHREARCARTPSPTRNATSARTTARTSPWSAWRSSAARRRPTGKDVWEGGKILDPENGQRIHAAPHARRRRQEARSARLVRSLRPHPDLGARAVTFLENHQCTKNMKNAARPSLAPTAKGRQSMSRFQVKKVAVLGAGVMGAQIAAHLVNVKVPVVLFDLPRQGRARRTASSPRPSRA